MSHRRAAALLFVAVCLIAANLRITITGVGPVIDQIADDLGAAPATLGLLGSVPLLSWAVLCPFAYGLSRRIGMTPAVSVALVALAVGTLWRSLPGGPAGLWLGSVLIGLGTAIGNVLLPVVIKRGFVARVPVVMGVYSAMVAGAGALGAGMVVPVSHLEVGGEALGWRIALLCSGVLVVPALAVWVWAAASGVVAASAEAGEAAAPPASGEGSALPPADRPAAASGRASGVRSIWGDRLAWFVSLYMGAQAAVFFALSTWLAAVEGSFGRSPVLAGFDVMMMSVLAIPGSLAVPVLYGGRLRRWLPVLIPLPLVVAIPGFLIAPGLSLLWAGICGVVLGASLSMALLLIAVRSRGTETATALSGMVHSVGYAIGASGPIAFGWLYQATGGWTAPFALLLVFTAALAWAGVVTGRGGYVLELRRG